MRTMTLTLALLGALTLTGCPKNGGGGGGGKAPTAEMLLTNPAANFQMGLSTLQSPDKKTGVVNYQQAYDYFNASQNLQGGAKAAFNAGWTAEALGRPDLAEQHYRAAYELDPSNEKAMYSLARLLTEQKKAGEAVALYGAHAEKNSGNLEVRNDYVAALVAAGRYDDAIAQAQEILRKDPKNAAVYRNLSALYYAQGNYPMSQLTAEKSLQLNDGDPGTYNNMGVTYLEQGDEPAAIAKFKEAVKLDGGNFEANMNLGYVALNSGDYTLALSCFQSASGTNPASLDAKLGLAVALRGTGEFKAAGELYDTIIAADRSNQAGYFNAAFLNLYYTKDFAKAAKYLTAFKDTHAGQIGPTHEVFAILAKVEEERAKEEAKKAEELARKKAEEERQRRNEELLKNMASLVSESKKKLDSYGANPDCIDPGSVEEIGMMLEQAQMVIDAKDVDMAADIQTLLDAYIPAMNDVFASNPACGGAPAAQDGGAEDPSAVPAPE